MKMAEAMAIIEKRNTRGFLVHFEKRIGGVLESEYFPDIHAGEKSIATEEQAWSLAMLFSNAAGPDYVNIYVVHGAGGNGAFTPVTNYRTYMLNEYPKRTG